VDALIQVCDCDADGVASLTRCLAERNRVSPVDRAEPEMAEENRNGNERREDRGQAKRAHAPMIADAADG
jgi:hypothetical protein